MNERIENLCLAAGLYAKLPNGNNYPVTMSAEEQCESLSKFSELIVQDCYGIMEKYSRANMESDMWVEMIIMMQKELKQHFGVKE